MPDEMRDYLEMRIKLLEARTKELEEALWLVLTQARGMTDPSQARDAIITTARQALKVEG